MNNFVWLATLLASVMTAPLEDNHHIQHNITIDYKNGLFYEDLARKFMVLVMPDGCYFWHMTHNEASTGLSPSGLRHIESAFVADLDNGVDLTRLHRSNFNHMAGSIVYHCKSVDSYLIHREHNDHLTDLTSVDLQGTLPPNITIIHASSRH